MLPCHVIVFVFYVLLCVLTSFHMILMYFSQANKAPARSLDACLGEGVVASNAGPSIFPWWLPSRSPIPPSTLNLPP